MEYQTAQRKAPAGGGTTCRLSNNYIIIQCDKMLILANIPLFCFFGSGRSVLLSFVVSEEAELCN